MKPDKYLPIIGLEVHVELATASKMFCGCPAEHFGVEANTRTCPVCLGLPGALPVANKKAIDWTMMLGLALGCKINQQSKFDRKNYFYPDLPKGYQITQYDQPLCQAGRLRVTADGVSREIGIRRVHLEEDTGKLIHTSVGGEKVALVDFNRSGVALVEIVTEPDFHSVNEVDTFLKNLQKIVRYLGISGADMEKGSMRLEPSISIAMTPDPDLPSYRVELKNINSFRFARKALEFEVKRQVELLERGENPIQQTRGWNEVKGETTPQREKEEAHDYRYFPEPDIPPLAIDQKWIETMRFQIPELPDAKEARFISSYALSQYTAALLVDSAVTADFFEKAVKDCPQQEKTGKINWPRELANWIVNKNVDLGKTVPADLIKQIVNSKARPETNLRDLEELVEAVLKDNPRAVSDYQKGKTQALDFLIGLVKGKMNVDSHAVSKLLESKLTSYGTS